MQIDVPACLQNLAPRQDDTTAVLLAKQQKLLFIKQVYEAWLARAPENGWRSTKQEQQQHQQQQLQPQCHPDEAPATTTRQQQAVYAQHHHGTQSSPPSAAITDDEQGTLPAGCQAGVTHTGPVQQEHQSQSLVAEQQQQRPLLRQLLGTASTDEHTPADMQQQSDQGHAAAEQQQHIQQQQQPSLQQHADGAMAPPPALQQPSSHKQLLARLLQPGAASIPPPRQQQQQQLQAGPSTGGRQRRLPNGRLSLPGMPGGSTAGAAGANRHHATLEESPGPLQQEQLLQLRAHHLLDAQSQAPGASAPAAAMRTAGKPAVSRRISAAQQLLSPKTATHAPTEPAGSGGSSRHGGGSGGSAELREHSSTRRCKDTAAGQQQLGALLGHQQHATRLQDQKQHLLSRQEPPEEEEEQPEEIEVTPSQPQAAGAAAASAAAACTRRSGQQQRWGSGIPTETTTAGGGPGGRAAAGAAPYSSSRTAAADVHAMREPQHVATTAYTPATANTELIAATGSRRAAAAAAAGLAAALFHTPAPAAAGSRLHNTTPPVEAGGPAGVYEAAPAAAAADLDCIAGSSPLEETAPSAGGCVVGSLPHDETEPPAEQLQHQQQEHDQHPMSLGELQPAAARAALTPARYAVTPEGAASVSGQAHGAASGAFDVHVVPATPISCSQGQADSAALQQQQHCSTATRQAVAGMAPPVQLLPPLTAAECPELQLQQQHVTAAGQKAGQHGQRSSKAELQLQQQEPALQQQQQEAAAHAPVAAAHGAHGGDGGAAAAVVPVPNARLQCFSRSAHSLQRPSPHNLQLLGCSKHTVQQAGQDRSPSPAAAAGTAGQARLTRHAAIPGISSNTLALFQQQQRVQKFQLGLPIVHIMCCNGYAAVVQQQAPDMHKLLLLHIHRQQQQQQHQAVPTSHQQPLLPALPQPPPPEQQQQQRAQEVMVTVACSPVFLSQAQHRATTPLSAGAVGPTAVAAAAKQHHSTCGPNLLRSGLLMLPGGPQGMPAPSTWQGPYLAVVSQLQLHTNSSTVAETTATVSPAAAGAGVTPAQQQHLARACFNSSSSSSKRKLRKVAAAALEGADNSPGAGPEGETGHGIYIFQLVAGGGQQQQQTTAAAEDRQDFSSNSNSSGGEAVLVQRLSTARPVKCLAACPQSQLLAGAGAGGFACLWPLQQQQQQQPATHLPAVQPVAAEGARLQQAAGGCQAPVADAAAAVVLPAACYKGIAFPDISEICFVVQGASSSHACGQQEQSRGKQPDGGSSSSMRLSGLKVLLVACCSQGPVAVWDVGRCQQIMAIHRPELRIAGLQSPGQDAVAAALAAVQATQVGTAGLPALRGSHHHYQQQNAGDDAMAQQPVVLLATVESFDTGSSSDGGGGGTTAAAGSSSSRAKQATAVQGKQLRAVALHGNGDVQLSRPLIAAASQGGVLATALSGSTVAALMSTGVTQAWDVVRGQNHMCAQPAAAKGAGAAAAVALLPLAVAPVLKQDDDSKRAAAGVHHHNSRGQVVGKIVLIGASDGALTAVLI